jgi:tetratricopeptide (TPR) repeat protein
VSFDEALQLVRGRLDEFQTSGDPGVILSAESAAEAAALMQALRESGNQRIAEAYHALGWRAYLRYNELPRGEDQPELAIALAMLTPLAGASHMLPEPMLVVIGPSAEPTRQAGLAVGLLEYAQENDNALAVGEAIALLTKAVEATPADRPERREHASTLAAAHLLRFDRTGMVDDARLAVAFGEAALAATPEEDDARAYRLYNLRGAYEARFDYLGDIADLQRAIELGEQAIVALGSGPDRFRFLANLGSAYQARFESLGDAEDLQKAIDASTEAIAGTGQDSPQRPRMLSLLRSAYRARYTFGGQLEDLEMAIDLGEQAVAATGETRPERVRYLSNLGGMYSDRFKVTGVAADLARGIGLNEQALRAAPAKHSDRPAMLSNLSSKYRTKFERLGDPADLDRAITHGEQAVALTPPGHSSTSMRLSTLGASFMARYDLTGALPELDRGIELTERAWSGAPLTDSGRFIYAMNLSGAYGQRFERSGIRADLDRAVEFGEAAVQGAPPGHVERVPAIMNLASAYAERSDATARTARRSGPGTDLARAIELAEQALTEIPDGHRDRPGRMTMIGRLYQSRYNAEGGLENLERAVGLHEEAVAATPDDDPQLARMAGGLARAYSSWANTVFKGDIDEVKVRSVAAHAARAQASAPADRIYAGLATGFLATIMDDAETAVGAFDRAVALLPTVARGDLDRAEKEYRLSSHFGLAAETISAHLAAGDASGAVAAAEASRGVLLAAELASRNAPAGVSRPTEPEPPAGGTVVLLNFGITRRDAVIVEAGTEPRAIRLPDSNRFDDLRWAEEVIAATQAPPSLTGTLRRQRIVADVLRWLWDDVVAPVLAALPAQEEPHRLWWLPVGYLAAFPFHAAGYPGEAGALDRSVSSYLPTLRSLDQARRRPQATNRQQLTVSLTHTLGLPDIPGAAAEAADLHALYPAGLQLTDDNATAGKVLAGLADCTWAHFACHASADLAAPSQGGLHLHDRTLRLPEISELRLDGAELAFLSACSTAGIGSRHANESIHLASAFQLAGFRHVIASLWPLADSVAAAAARSFYRELPDRPDADAAAVTLRKVVLSLRETHPGRPDLWASLVHSGP